MKGTCKSAWVAAIAVGLIYGAGIPVKADSLEDALIVLIDPPAALIVYTEDCDGQLTSDGHAAIENLRKYDSSRMILNARLGAWRRELRSMSQVRKCSKLSRYLAGSYAREFVAQPKR